MLKDNVEQFLSDLGGKIGYDIIRNKVGGYVMQSIAQVGLAMRQAITLGIPGRVFHSHKIFVDKDLIYCGLYDREKEFTTVFTHNQTTYMKRFSFGGAIQNKEYRLAPDPARILFFQEGPVDTLYVKYRKEKRQRIHQQAFDTSQLLVKGAKARGAQMTMKRISSIHTSKPKGWSDDAGQPAGALLDF